MHKNEKDKLREKLKSLSDDSLLDNPMELVDALKSAYEQTITYIDSLIAQQEETQEEKTPAVQKESEDPGEVLDLAGEIQENIPEEEQAPEPRQDKTEAPESEKDKEEKEMSFHEKIQKILENAPKIETKVSAPQENSPKETSGKPDKPEAKAESTQTDEPKASFEEEFKDAISADYAAEMFDKSTPVEEKKTLNDKLSKNQLVIGLNDRIAFVKHLFKGDLYAFNQALDKIQEFDNYQEAIQYISMELKGKYNWGEKVSGYETRFVEIIQKKFG